MDTTSSQEDVLPVLLLIPAVQHATTILQVDKQSLILLNLHQATATKRMISSSRVGLVPHAPYLTVQIVIILPPAWLVQLDTHSTNSSIVIFAMFWDVMNA